MTTTHTPGEWITKEGSIYPQETGKTLAFIPYFDKEDKEQEANAKLIAAAPEMLELIERMKGLIELMGTGHREEMIEKSILATAERIIRTATE
jgi:hypothetical protein